jgi:hypothetical protein
VSIVHINDLFHNIAIDGMIVPLALECIVSLSDDRFRFVALRNLLKDGRSSWWISNVPI